MTAAASRLVRLVDGPSRAILYPEQGFQLHGFATSVTGRGGGEPFDLIFGPDPAVGREPADRRYGNPVLFPSVGVTAGPEPDRWLHAGRALPMPQHGWARDAYWYLEALDDRSIVGSLVPTTGIRAGFPFAFRLCLRYALEGGALTLSAEVANSPPEGQGGEPFPYALGFHPYLRAPLAPGGTRAGCRVRLPAGVRLRSSDDWRTIERSASPARTVEVSDPELSGSIVLGETGSSWLEVEDSAAGVAARVSIEGSEASFPIWVVWSASPDAPYLCLEPWTDAPNALNRPGTRAIDPGATHRYRMTISLRAI